MKVVISHTYEVIQIPVFRISKKNGRKSIWRRQIPVNEWFARCGNRKIFYLCVPALISKPKNISSSGLFLYLRVNHHTHLEIKPLIAALQQKDVRAFETLYNMYSTSISGVICHILRDQALAEEVLQDVFVKVWHNSSSYDAGKGRFFTWILNIARNAAIDKTRSKDFKASKKNLDTDLFVDILHDDDQLDKKTDAIGIRKYIGQLADKCKDLIAALYFKGYTQKETAELLDIPIGTVKTRNRNCINDLRTLLNVPPK